MITHYLNPRSLSGSHPAVRAVLKAPVTALLILIGLGMGSTRIQAACPGICGDVNGSGTVTSADVVSLVHYLYLAGPAPVPDCGDMDDYLLTSVRDLIWMVRYLYKGGPAGDCDPDNGPLEALPTTVYTITHEPEFPAGVTDFTVSIILQSNAETYALTLPLAIFVGGDPAGLGVLTMNPIFQSIPSAVSPPGSPANSVLLGPSQLTGDALVAGTYTLATLDLVMPASLTPRPITIVYITMPPVEAGLNINSALLIDGSQVLRTLPGGEANAVAGGGVLNAWRPFLADMPGTGSISGVKFEDADGNCAKGLLEPVLAGWWIYLLPMGWLDVTDANGEYSFPALPAGTYTVQEVQKPWWAQTCPTGPSTYTINLADGAQVTGYDFGNQLQAVQDLRVWVAGGPARPGFEKLYAVQAQNIGNVGVSADVTIELPAEVTYQSSVPSGSYNLILHEVSWNAGALAPGATFLGTVATTVGVSAPLGTDICATATVDPIAGDAALSNNTDTECQIVRGSYDPNEKRVTPVGTGAPGFVYREDTLRYHIDFQNTGTDTAFNIVVRDTVDDDMDITTLSTGAASHPYTLDVNGRELSFIFSNIMLPDSLIDEPGSHGFVEYTLRPSQAAPDGAALPNKAGIYFDFNPPVITNEVTNTICPVVVSGDVNNNGTVTSSDVIALVNYIFKGGAPPQPVVEAGDINCDGVHTSSDIINLVNYVFKSGQAPCDVCAEL